MKNALLALTLCAFVGTATAHDNAGRTARRGKKATACTMQGGSCCAKKDAKVTIAKASAAKPAAKAQ